MSLVLSRNKQNTRIHNQPHDSMETCNEVVDQLRALDEAEARVEEYRRHYLERGQALVQDKDAWIKTWHAKVVILFYSGCELLLL